jgi:lipopolysaccharide transport system ATP-binding protein
MTPSLRIEHIGKRYRLGAHKEPYRTLRDTIAGATRVVCSRLAARGDTGRARPHVWALRDVSFEVEAGTVLGLIGRNGAGKSTLLKILSRITDPTVGLVEIRGRVGSLLEVGTGFHPELTGRENVFLSGAILGMQRHEITRKFDEIVAFAEIDPFVDTPVKHYSSGMYLRLAFAVAAHLETEILLVDEVLAVGDARFQRKCMDKMQGVGEGGRTVIFVSHSMPSIARLCERAVLLDEGVVARDGAAHEVVGAYLNSGLGTMAAREWPDPAAAPQSGVVRLRAVRVRDSSGRVADAIDIRERVGIELEYDVLQPDVRLLPHFTVTTAQGVLAFVGLDRDPRWRGQPRPCGRYVDVGWIPGNFLAEGAMLVGAAMRAYQPDTLHFYERDAVAFQVLDPATPDTVRGEYPGGIPGAVRPALEWTTSFTPAGAHEGAAGAGARGA